MIVRAEHLQAGYGTGEPVIRDVEFAAGAGQTVAVLAPNGGGKTTLFRTLLGELTPLGGTFSVDGTLAAVHQHDHARLDFPVSALDVALMGAYGRTPWWRRLAGSDRAAARAALERVGCAALEDRPVGTLSLGERARVLIARALVAEPDLLLFDEPAAGLDLPGREALLAAMTAVGPVSTTVLATHHLEELPPTTTHAALLRDGGLLAAGPVDEVLVDERLSACFGLSVRVMRDGDRWSARGA